ncbi:efflux transporter periplasmic adaptor subunit [Coraliomargarita sinensis]|uniref:Efflux transporter periplasmic adaptor subunit n=1 Tax=Coraliomargarita sinensis TaxID=2174842 RepID=A0A317ZI76_9BACT|nr:efflux RND transporter periplasmic adaptor subunit [Coraliomargarita sinensis]PXA03997.1 efflux transporter periplasmic adaptor subunit [Coraliomargarita sinensis]
MKKTIFILSLFLGVILLIAFLVGTKMMQFGAMAEAGANGGPPPETVSSTEASTQVWQTRLRAVGTIEPVQGILIESETSGLVDAIAFENGQEVQKGDLLVQLDIDVEKAQLRAAVATAKLADLEYERAKSLRASGSIPESRLDSAAADLERAQAEIENINAVIDRKTIKAPFDGRVGIRQINLGQYVPLGSPIVNLQSDENVYANFSLPQKDLSQIEKSIPLTVRSDAYPEKEFQGELTAISPEIDATTRSVALQGTLQNADGLLRSGLFVEIEINLPDQRQVVAVPSTAILYAPYGNSVFVIEESEGAENGEGQLTARQKFIRIGQTRGDYVSIVEGLKPGERIVSAGGFKLRNGSRIRINNELAPEPKTEPRPNNT